MDNIGMSAGANIQYQASLVMKLQSPVGALPEGHQIRFTVHKNRSGKTSFPALTGLFNQTDSVVIWDGTSKEAQGSGTLSREDGQATDGSI